MPRGTTGWYQRSAKPFLPYIGHVTPDVILLEDGSLLAMGRLRGIPHELAAASERNAAALALNTLWRNIADDNVTICAHLVRHKVSDDRPAPHFRNDFAARFFRTYRQHILNQLYLNEWFLSLLVSPRLVPVGPQKFRSDLSRIISRFRRTSATESADLSLINDLWSQLAEGLGEYNLARLGIRSAGDRLYSEIAEAIRLMLTVTFEPVPLVWGPLGNAVYTDPVIFEKRIHRILSPGVDDESEDGPGIKWGAIFGLREYMAETQPDIFDALLQLPMELVLSQSMMFMSRARAVSSLSLKRDQMKAAGDQATRQRKQLKKALSSVAGSEVVRGVHHLSLAVYGNTYPDLVSNAAVARTSLSNSGATVAQESAGNEAAYFAQVPGNWYWRTRRDPVSSRNFADFAGFGAFPHGASEGRWGPAMITFKTTAGTAYDFIPHVDDVGMTAIFGRISSGKTTFLMMLLAMFDHCIGDDGVVFFFDKDAGGELLVRAVDGAYLKIRSGESSGLAPLRGLSNTHAARQFLSRWVRALILLDGLGPLPADDHARIAVGISAIMRKPVQLRSLAGLRQYLGWRDTAGAGARLERWCRGGELGWVFDGEEDEVDIDARVVGFDMTAILEDKELAAPAAQYLLHRIRSVIDGRRAVISLDECRAYMLHDQFQADTEDFLLTARKNNAIVILCTQEPEHLLSGTFGPTMVSQCMTKVFFRDPTADEKIYKHCLFLTEGEYRAVREGMPPGSRQCLLKRDSGSVIIDFDLSPMREFVDVLSGRARTVRFAERLREQHPDDWVEKFMSRDRAKEGVD